MTLKELQKKVLTFRDKRDWKQFHNPKDSAVSLTLESTEVLEHFQWKNGDEITKHVEAYKKDIAGELADVLYWILLLSYDLNINLEKAFTEKMAENTKKYPVKKAKGKSLKYTHYK